MGGMGIVNIDEEIKNRLAQIFFEIAANEGIHVSACGNIDLAAAGIPPAKCIAHHRVPVSPAKRPGSED